MVKQYVALNGQVVCRSIWSSSMFLQMVSCYLNSQGIWSDITYKHFHCNRQINAESARESAKFAGEKIYAGGAAAGSAVKSKLDETGVSEAAKKAADTVTSNVKYAGSVVSEKIEANPTLSSMKRSTTQKMGQAAAYMGSLVGWGGSNAGTGEESKEETKDEGNDSFEESKEEGEP